MNFDTIEAIAEKLRIGQISSLELCRELLAASHKQNPFIGAFSQLLAETSMAEAAASDARRRASCSKSALDGVPVAIKDLIDTRPAICKAGLDHLSNYLPLNDAPVVKSLREAGAVIIGVTETDPGAFSTDTPQSVNPLAPDRTVGGSSGGSGAVVAAGLAFAALGTDTGGSIRIPAACCSVYGFKPTWGRVDCTGVRPLAPSLDHVGPLARSVTDLQIVQSILDPTIGSWGASVPGGALTIGIDHQYFADADGEVQSAMAQLSDVIGGNWRMRRVCLPKPDEVMAFHMVNLPKEAADYHTQNFPRHWPGYPEIARATVSIGSTTSQSDYESAQRLRKAARAAVDSALEDVDAILLPTMPTDAPLRDASNIRLNGSSLTKLEATVRYTSLFNQTGHPVVAMPAILQPNGRAVSVQLVGRRDRDDQILRVARRVEHLLSAKIDYPSIIRSRAEDVQRVRAEIR